MELPESTLKDLTTEEDKKRYIATLTAITKERMIEGERLFNKIFGGKLDNELWLPDDIK